MENSKKNLEESLKESSGKLTAEVAELTNRFENEIEILK